MKRSPFFLPLIRHAATLALVLSPLATEGAPLWRIGDPDQSTAEFALAPDGYRSFSRPGAFMVGLSDPSRDWPYIFPGKADRSWAPDAPYSFRIWFALSELPTQPSTLLLDLADTHQHNPPTLRVAINDRASEHRTPPGNGGYARATGGRARALRIAVPPEALRVGLNEVTLTNIDGSWLLWDSLAFEAGTGATPGRVADFSSSTIESVRSSIELLKSRDGTVLRRVFVDVLHVGDPTSAELVSGPAKHPIRLVPGLNRLAIGLPPAEGPTTRTIGLRLNGKTVSTGTVELDKTREWTVHLIPQTHLDIGYTDFQENVLARQVDHFRAALKLIDKTGDYPEGSRFVWHPEGMWAVEEFMRVATPAEREAFLRACRDRTIHLDALYAQAMTGLYTGEELMELMSAAKRFAREHGIPIDSAMQSDVPGYTWGLATALAANGIRHISLGPNVRHRIGHVLEWGDRPFYWETPDGRDRILFWMTSKGYSFFRYATENPKTPEENQLHRKMPEVLAMLRELENDPEYPYDMLMLRYAIGGNNGPPDPMLPEVVRAWNETHVSPRFVISGNSDFLHAFEEKYGDDLPVMRGDYTPYWEDGAASTAKATAVNRRTSERIAQAQILWAMKNPSLPLHERVDTIWRKIMLYDEHTWGSYNSISEPDSDFARRQDEYKQAYAFDAADLTDALLRRIAPPPVAHSTFDVHNTASWTRSDWVVLENNRSSAGDLVRDDNGKPVPSQRLASGELAFLAKDVRAFGTRRYTIEPGNPPSLGSATAAGNRVANDFLELTVDRETGAISSLKRKDAADNWVDASTGAGLNDYLYILGRDPATGRSTITGPVSITVEDPGPLIATLKIESGAPGAAKLVRRVRLIHGQDRVELVNIVEKLEVRDPEGVYFGFPFNLPDAVSRVDTPWASVEVETEQLPGANRNFYCVQRFVDLANGERGMTWVTVDAPLVQFDPISIGEPYNGNSFATFIDPGSFLWSWTMNNHWEVNYKADQEGELTFRYALRPYVGDYDAAAAERFARNICQPLLATAVEPGSPASPSLLGLEGDAAIVATQLRPSRDGKAWMIRLFNTSEETASTRLVWNRPVGKTFFSNPMEETLDPAPQEVNLVSQQVMTLRVEH